VFAADGVTAFGATLAAAIGLVEWLLVFCPKAVIEHDAELVGPRSLPEVAAIPSERPIAFTR
jgi:hypothetical protein